MQFRERSAAMIVGTLCLAVAWVMPPSVLRGHSEEKHREAASEYSLKQKDTEDFFTGSMHYEVPKAYRPSIAPYSKEKNYSAMSMMLILPDFSPAAEHPEELKRIGWHRQLTMLFEQGPRWATGDEQASILTNNPRGVHTSPEPASNGCTLYRTPLAIPGDVYVCPQQGDKFVLSCRRKADVPFPSCTSMTNVGPDLSLIYSYSLQFIGDAIAIDARIRALVVSFVASQPNHR